MKTYLLQRIARFAKRRGFTLVELLVVIAIIAILAGVALGPITNGIKQAKHNAAMQSAYTLGQLSFNYSSDNTTGGNAYPGGTSAAAIATLLITSGYATDASIFYVSGQKTFTAATSSTAIGATNVSWCYTVDTDGSSGLTSCGDTIPIVFFDKSSGTSPITAFSSTANTAVNGTVTSASPQGTDGMAVFYKGNNATYIKATSGGFCAAVIPASNDDTNVYQVAP